MKENIKPWRTMEEINEGLKKARQDFLLNNNNKINKVTTLL